MTFMRWTPVQYSPISAVLVEEIPVSPIPSRKRQTRMRRKSSRKNGSTPITVNITSEMNRTLAFPKRSARAPMTNPKTATDRAGRPMIRAVMDSFCPKNSPIPLSEGATAAAPMRMTIEDSRMVKSVTEVGLNVLA